MSWHSYAFCITGHLWEKFISHRWIPLTRSLTKGQRWIQDDKPWWRHQMEAFSALLALCEGNPPITGEFPSQRPVTRSFDAFLHLCLNKRLSKPSSRRWFETPSHLLWRHWYASDEQNMMSSVFSFSACGQRVLPIFSWRKKWEWILRSALWRNKASEIRFWR